MTVETQVALFKLKRNDEQAALALAKSLSKTGDLTDDIKRVLMSLQDEEYPFKDMLAELEEGKD